MNIKKIISVLAVLTIVLVSSCSKMEPLKERVECCESISGEAPEATAIMVIDNNNDSNGITDPDHDEEHDKDDSAEANKGE
ncbi:MAG: hypothetical protein H6599_02350 [Flavobacteriales bacterium]|nr:hypothetical protein [Flavobacteriales bacterium]